ncbi:hypothetical protein V2J09_003696 [Rumex salicifolius]
MASFPSLVSLGSSGATSSSGNCELFLSLVSRSSVPRGVCCCSFRHLGRRRKWRYVSVCKYSVTADYASEQGNVISLENVYRGSKDEDPADLILKPAPKPVLKPGPVPQIQSGGNSTRDVSSINGNSNDPDDAVERKKVIESLDEVLEKAEKLETAGSQKVDGKKESRPVNRPASGVNSASGNGRPKIFTDSRNSRPSKSVWRKGSPVTNVQNIVKDAPKTDKYERVDPKIQENGRAELQSSQPQAPSTLSPPPLKKPDIKLQARPSIAPPSPPKPKRPPTLLDVGAAPKSRDVNKERKPILVDKFASKKPVVDPLVAQAVIAPPKPSKVPSGKFKEDYRKKSGVAGAPRRRILNNDEIPDEEASELGLPTSRASTARKGRKWNKASRKAARLQAARDAAPVKVEILEVDEDGMSTEELAYNLAIGEGEIFGYLYNSRGIRPDGVFKLDRDMVKMICKEYEVEVIDAVASKVEDMARKKEFLDEDDLDKLEDRPPVITIMGHVDHGKTTLLDYVRKSKVAAGEAGGITQGIGAYTVQVPVDGKTRPCVFLDTPGHEAFGAMRARGARVTDIAIVVVAADDGIRPQTNEAIAHAKAANVPIVIAINKIDKDGANPDRVMQELSQIGLMPEEWGGDVPMVQISALKGENVDDLLETVMLVAELDDLKANPDRNARGTVIEAGLDKSKGPVATFIVQNGTLKKGDVVVCGEAFGKVRALFDDGGNRVNEAGPSIPVQVIGLNNVPLAGDVFEAVNSLDVARERAETRAESLRDEHIAAKAGDGMVTLSSLASAISSGKVSGLDLHQLNVIMKVDLQGSIEAVRQALQVLPQDNVTLKFLLQATGDISTSDVDLAVATKAIIIGFNVKTPGSVKSYADNKGIEIRIYKVIYDLIDDMRNAMEGLLDLVEEQVKIGEAEVRATFSSGSGRVAGCMVTEGKFVKGCGIRAIRKRKTVFVGALDSLRRVKEAVKEVSAGLECGIGSDKYDDWEEGDVIEAFETIQKKRTLEEASATVTAALEGAGIAR